MQYISEQQIAVNDITLNYDSFGDPQHPALILIMGLATQMIFWDSEMCRKIAQQGFWVLRFDNRDIGKSSRMTQAKTPHGLAFMLNVLWGKKLKSPYLLSDMAADTLGLMDALNIVRAHLVGASMGGMIAQLMAIAAPHRVMSLTSIMSTTGNRSLPRASNSTLFKLMATPARNVDDYVKQGLMIWKILHADVYPFEEYKVRQLLTLSWQRGLNAAGISRQLAAILASPDRTADLAKMQIPTLVIHGEIDPLLPLACGLATAKAISNARLVTYSGMGHTIPQEVQREVAAEIVSLAKSCE
jgi:pimeloyl-ACP methyl ester carboxylesterase